MRWVYKHILVHYFSKPLTSRWWNPDICLPQQKPSPLRWKKRNSATKSWIRIVRMPDVFIVFSRLLPSTSLEPILFTWWAPTGGWSATVRGSSWCRWWSWRDPMTSLPVWHPPSWSCSPRSRAGPFRPPPPWPGWWTRPRPDRQRHRWNFTALPPCHPTARFWLSI